MGRSAEIYIKHKSEATEAELIRDFLEIVTPLGYDTSAVGSHEVYMAHKENPDKAVRVWVHQDKYKAYTINGEDYYLVVFYDFIWDDERHGIEFMNSDMILAITAEYMKKYPDALFHYEWSKEDSMFMDKTDIDSIMLQTFQPVWFFLYKSHRISSRVNNSHDDWTLR